MHEHVTAPYRSLSCREELCLSLAWAGKVLAPELSKFGLTVTDCDTALHSAARKFEVPNPTEAVVHALRLNLLSPI